MNLGDIALMSGGIILGGGIGGTAAYSLFRYVSGEAKINREQQKDIANEWNLPLLYCLNLEQLALPRVKDVHEMVSNPSQRKYYHNVDHMFPILENADNVLSILEKYLPAIAEQSDIFKNDPTQTNAFKQFLNEDITKQWLTDPAFAMSDREYKWRTSFIGEQLRLYIALKDLMLYKISKSQKYLQKIDRFELSC